MTAAARIAVPLVLALAFGGRRARARAARLRGSRSCSPPRTIRRRSPIMRLRARSMREIAAREIDAALAADDADLAVSFLELARDRNVPVDAGAGREGRAGECSRRHRRALARELRPRPRHRRARGSVGTRRHGSRRSVRLRRYPRRAARGHAARQRAGGRRADPRLRLRRARGDGGHLCDGRRRGAGARGTDGGQGGAQDRPDRRRRWRRGSTARVREVVDWTALKRAVRGASLDRSPRPPCAPRARRSRSKRRDDLVRFVGDVGRVQARAGTQAALDGLKLAEGPRDMSRVARLAAAKGGKTRAILKLAGRARYRAHDGRLRSRDVGVLGDPDGLRLGVVAQAHDRADHRAPLRAPPASPRARVAQSGRGPLRRRRSSPPAPALQ